MMDDGWNRRRVEVEVKEEKKKIDGQGGKLGKKVRKGTRARPGGW